MEIIDTHMHINSSCNNEYYRNKKINDYLTSIKNNHIDFFIPSINPKANFFTCSKDCSQDCQILTKDNCVCPVICKERNRHRIKIVDGLEGNLIAYCTTCNEKVYEGIDPFRKYNLELIELCQSKNNALPNLVLTLSNSTINNEVLFYEKNFPNYFLGYKIHQTVNMRGINTIEKINSNKTILVHSDIHPYDSIQNILDFSKHYNGNIVIAHSYLLYNQEIIKNLNNIYFDICPCDNFLKYKNNIKHNPYYDKYPNMFDAAIKYLPEDKLLFGTDWPYGNVEDNINEIKKSTLPEQSKQKILKINAKKAYHI